LRVTPQLTVDDIDRVLMASADQDVLLMWSVAIYRHQPPGDNLGNQATCGSDVMCDRMPKAPLIMRLGARHAVERATNNMINRALGETGLKEGPAG